MTWNELYLLLRDRIGTNKSFGEEIANVYCAGSGEYFPVDAVEVDVEDTDELVIVIQN